VHTDVLHNVLVTVGDRCTVGRMALKGFFKAPSEAEVSTCTKRR